MRSEARPWVVATLPGRSAASARRQAALAATAGADIAEIRFDRWSPEERTRSGELFPSPLPLMATLRSRSEGGEGPDEAGARARWISEIRQLPFDWIDLEADRDLTGQRPEPPALGGWIVSAHLDGRATADAIHRRLARALPPASVAKLVVPASVRFVVEELVPHLPPAGGGRRIVMTTGSSGALLRAWSRRLGFAGVYGSLPADEAGDAPVEASQVPVDRLRWFLDGPPSAPLFAILGRPVAHSRSPALHHYWMEQLGHRGLYIPIEVDSDSELAALLEPLRSGGFRGVNVTHPFKEAALGLATRAGPGARAAGCANTLTFRVDEIEAENTDLVAVLRRLEELRSGGAWNGRTLTVLGTGGAARATLAAARSLGARAEVLGRRADRVARVRAEFGVEWEPTAADPPGLIVNATTVGRAEGGSLAFDLRSRIGPSTYLLDFVYRPDDPVLASLVSDGRGRYEDGRRLLAYAAAATYQIWWGEGPPPSLVDSAIEVAS